MATEQPLHILFEKLHEHFHFLEKQIFSIVGQRKLKSVCNTVQSNISDCEGWHFHCVYCAVKDNWQSTRALQERVQKLQHQKKTL